MRAAATYYDRDAEAQQADTAVIEQLMTAGLQNPKHAEHAKTWLEQLPEVSSGINVAEAYAERKKFVEAMDIARLLVANDFDAAAPRMETWLDTGTVANDEEIDGGGIEALPDSEEEATETYTVWPAVLETLLDDSVQKGHHIVIHARPEVGKTATAINLAAGFLKQGLSVLYLGNEEPALPLQRRLVSRLSGIGISALRGKGWVQQTKRAKEILEQRGLTDWRVLHAGTDLFTIKALVKRYKPGVLVVDQLRNVDAKSESSAGRYEVVARAMRNIANEHNLIAVSVVQAGDSAQDKLVLDMSDIDGSRTGVQGACDIQIGVGTNDDFRAQNKLMLSISRNKASGRHGHVPCWIDHERSALLSQPPQRRASA